MPLARINGQVVFFAHVPKCGGTSITAFLRRHGRVALDGDPTPDWSRCTSDHVHAAILGKLVPAAFYDHGFIVFRDPIERLRSEFRMYARPRRKSRNPVNWALHLYARLRGRKAYSVGFMRRYWTVDIDTWLRLSLLVTRFMPYRGNNHFRRQCEFWQEDLKPFLLEDGLDSVARWLSEVTGLEGDPPMLHEKPPQPHAAVADATFSETSQWLIRRHYAEDYRLLVGLGLTTNPMPAKDRDASEAMSRTG